MSEKTHHFFERRRAVWAPANFSCMDGRAKAPIGTLTCLVALLVPAPVGGRDADKGRLNAGSFSRLDNLDRPLGEIALDDVDPTFEEARRVLVRHPYQAFGVLHRCERYEEVDHR
jgi:hypothetical protein